VADILSLDATAQLQALETRRVSAVELLDAVVARWRAEHEQINALVAVDLDRARARARSIDDQRVKGEAMGVLAGLPMTVKDTLDVEGLPASSGLKSLLNRQAKDAVAAAHARREGAVIWGKTNTPVMAGDWQTFNALYGTTNNPWRLDHTPGGSSGGAAAALATGVTALEIGSDIGGSLRIPAGFCGVYAHKPTWGMVSQRGHIPPQPGAHAERDLNVIGPMARSARDLRLLLSVLEEGPLAPKAPAAVLKETRIGLWLEEPAFALDSQVRAAILAFARELAGRGAAVEPIRPVDGAALIDAYQVLLGPIAAQDMPAVERARLESMRGPAKLVAAAAWAKQVLAYTATHAEWLAADEIRARIGDQLRSVFARHDVLIAPIAPVTAFAHDHRPFDKRVLTSSDSQKIAYSSMMNWIALASACGLPATAVPAGLAADGLPVGVQIIGPRAGDARTLAVAQAIEDELGGFMAPPTEL
jgi:amidase